MSAESVWDNPPPSAPAAELGVLGAVMLSDRELDDLVDMLIPADFYVPKNQLVWAAIMRLHSRGERPDPITVLAELAGDAQAAGGGVYLHTLVADVPTASNALHYGRLVADAATQRRVLAAAQRITAYAEHGVEDLADRSVAELDRAVRAGMTTEARPIGDLVDAAIDRLDSGNPIEGLATGYRDLDRGNGLGALLPMRPGRVYVIGGRTSIGKSVVGRDIARHVAVHLREPALLLSLEMGEDEVMTSLIAAQGRVSLSAMENHDMSEHDWDNIRKAREALIAAPLYLDCAGTQTLSSIRRAVRALRPRLVIVDYFQLVATDHSRQRREGLEELSRGFKLLAKAEQVAVVLLSQINRAPTARQDKRPLLSDLRETGAIEQDADTVILLHRPEADDPTDRPGEIDLIVAKQRGGPTGTAHLAAQLHYGRLSDLSKTLM